MVKFLVKLIIFILPVFAILIFLEINFNDTANSYSLRKEKFRELSKSIEILILGSSMEACGINPVYFNSTTYNLSFLGADLHDYKEIIYSYRDSLPNLKLIIIPISSFTLLGSSGLGGNEIIARKFYLYKYFNIYISNFSSFFGKNLFYIGTKQLISTLITHDLQKDEYNGYQPNFGVDWNKITLLYGKKTVNRHGVNLPIDKTDYIFTNNISILKKLILFLKEKEIMVCFITTPTHYSYYQNVEPDLLSLISSTMNNLCSQFQTKYFNYLQDKRFTDEDFFNCDHLNNNGAVKFSKIVNDEILPFFYQ